MRWGGQIPSSNDNLETYFAPGTCTIYCMYNQNFILE